MKIFKATPQDLDEVRLFWTKIFNEMGWEILKTDGFDDIPTYLHFPEGFLFVAKEDDQIIGCGAVKPLTESVALLKRFYIAAELRGKGVALQLLAELIEESKRRGFTELVLDVWNKNFRAIRFYEKRGFEKYNVTPNELWAESMQPETFFYYRIMLSKSEDK